MFRHPVHRPLGISLLFGGRGDDEMLTDRLWNRWRTVRVSKTCRRPCRYWCVCTSWCRRVPTEWCSRGTWRRYWWNCTARSLKPLLPPRRPSTSVRWKRPGNWWTRWWSFANIPKWIWRTRRRSYWTYCRTPISGSGSYTPSTRMTLQNSIAMNISTFSSWTWYVNASRPSSCSKRARRKCTMKTRTTGEIWQNWV